MSYSGRRNSRKEKNEKLSQNESKYPSTRTSWFYYKTETAEWEEFSDIECEIIEEAFHNQREEAELDSSVLDLVHLIATIKDDKSKSYSIKRMENVPKRLRQERFCPILENLSNSMDHRGFYFSQDRAKHHFAYSWHQFYNFEEDKEEEPQLIEQAAAGILIEGEKLGHRNEAQWIANNLLEVKDKSKQEIYERCIALYTRECFFYKLLNKTLRDDDTDKQETLAPFAYLLGCEALFTLSEKYHYKETVYRAMNLSFDQLDQYKLKAGDKEFVHWKNFASTTKNLAKAEFYSSNTIFYISLSKKKNATSALDITNYSYIPDEEEVLLTPPFYFYVKSVIYNNEKKRHDIFVKQHVFQNEK